ncbi:hypothetical protein KM043_004724 [Ampulex compressa]|nr:hypothetical protein KM043_004724 [Ampulex compressa]
MLSRATKSVAKSLCQRRYQPAEENLKTMLMFGEFGQSLSQMLKRKTNLDILFLYDVAGSNKLSSSKVQRLGTLKPFNDQVEELTQILRRFPVGEEVPSLTPHLQSKETSLQASKKTQAAQESAHIQRYEQKNFLKGTIAKQEPKNGSCFSKSLIGKSSMFSSKYSKVNRSEKCTTNQGQSKWMIPAILSNQKPKLLLELPGCNLKPMNMLFSTAFPVAFTEESDRKFRNHAPTGQVPSSDLIQAKFESTPVAKIKTCESAASRRYFRGKSDASTSTTVLLNSNCSSNLTKSTPPNFPNKNLKSDPNPVKDTSIVLKSSNTIGAPLQSTNSVDLLPNVHNPLPYINALDSTCSVSKKPLETVSSVVRLLLENLERRVKTRTSNSLASLHLEELFHVKESSDALTKEILFSKDCRPGIREKLKEFCRRRKANRADEDICKRRKNACGNSKRRKDPICQKKTSQSPQCENREQVEKLENTHSCRKNRKEEHQGPSCKRAKSKDSCDKYRRKEHQGPSCKDRRKEKSSDPCKERRKEVKSTPSCEKRAKKKSEGKSECPDIKKIEHCEKKACPEVVRAPGCSKGGGEEKGKPSCKKYSTFALKPETRNELSRLNPDSVRLLRRFLRGTCFCLESNLDLKTTRKARHTSVFSLLFGKGF